MDGISTFVSRAEAAQGRTKSTVAIESILDGGDIAGFAHRSQMARSTPNSSWMVQPAGADCGCGKKPFTTPHPSRLKRGFGSQQDASRERYEVHGGGRRPRRSCRSATCVHADCRMSTRGQHAPASEGSARWTWAPPLPSAPSHRR